MYYLWIELETSPSRFYCFISSSFKSSVSRSRVGDGVDARSLVIMSHSHPQYLTLKQQFCGIFRFSATGGQCHATSRQENLDTENISTSQKYFTHTTPTKEEHFVNQPKIICNKCIKILYKTDHLMFCVENILFFLCNEYSHTGAEHNEEKVDDDCF